MGFGGSLVGTDTHGTVDPCSPGCCKPALVALTVFFICISSPLSGWTLSVRSVTSFASAFLSSSNFAHTSQVGLDM